MTVTKIDVERGITVLMCVIDNMLGDLLHLKIEEIDLSGCRDPSFPPIEVSSGQPFSCCQTSCRQQRKWMWALTRMTEVGWP